MTAAALSGLLIGLTTRGTLPGLVACLALVPALLALARKPTALRAGAITLIAQLGLLLAAFEGAMPALPWTFPILLLLASPAAMFPGIVAALSSVRFASATGPRGLSLWSLPCSWTAAEFLASNRSLWGPLASPVSLAYTQFDTPLLSLAAVGGSAAVTFAVLAVNIALANVVLDHKIGPLPAIVMLGLILAGPASAAEGEVASDDIRPMRIGIVQPALASDWYGLATAMPDAEDVIFDRLLSLSRELASADLIVWPEGALPSLREEPVPLMGDAGPVILAGALTKRDGKRFNSVVDLAPGGIETVFDKLAPVPVGEAGMSAGERLTVGNWGGNWVAPLVCLDSLYSSFSRRLVRLGADVLVVVADDSFSQGMATPRLHLRASAFRAVETGLPVVFASAHGPSAVIDPMGRILARSEAGVSATLFAELPPPRPLTFYARHGDFVGVFATFATACLLLLILFRGAD